MAKSKFDAVVETVHYTPQGLIDWVRAYERRGATFSDRVLLNRQALVERLRAGKRFVAGRRVEYHASTFETSQPLRLVQQNGHEVVVVGEPSGNQDHLEGIPIF